MDAMNIGQAATASGVSAKMIRHYEQVGLFPEPHRTDAGYRQYTEREVHTLRFIRRARDLGFSIQQIGELVGLWQNRRRPSRQVKALAQAHIEELEQKTQELLAMKATLEHLVACCHGDDRPECPILEELAIQRTPAATLVLEQAPANPKTGRVQPARLRRRPRV
jgi:MerR family copper efflux transcriptional regulator